MNREQMAKVMDGVIEQMQAFRQAGQREYAHREDNAFGNFERVGERLSLTREQVLLVYLEKHLDGIHSYVKGHRSQREDVRGRIVDAIVYLTLLYGMVEENDAQRTQFKEEVIGLGYGIGPVIVERGLKENDTQLSGDPFVGQVVNLNDTVTAPLDQYAGQTGVIYGFNSDTKMYHIRLNVNGAIVAVPHTAFDLI